MRTSKSLMLLDYRQPPKWCEDTDAKDRARAGEKPGPESDSRLPEPLRRPQSGLGRFGLPVLRGRRRGQLIEQFPRGSRDVFHGAIEGRLIRLRWLGEPADLSDELE